MNPVSEIEPFAQLNQSRPMEANRDERLLQEDFLNLMVTQLRNQDPFKPMESGEFLGQLAQFGTVSGIDNLESAFESLANSLTSSQALQAASLVGREVLLNTGVGYLTEESPLTAAVELPFSAAQVTVGIYDSRGQLIKQIELGKNPEGRVEFSWDGTDTAGQRQPAGRYEIRAEATNAGVNQALEVMVAGQVKSVTLGGVGDPLGLEVNGLGDVDFSQVKQIS